MAPRKALDAILHTPERGAERLFLGVLALIALIIVTGGVVVSTLILVGNRRITRNQLEILTVAQRVAVNTDRMAAISARQNANTQMFNALAARVEAMSTQIQVAVTPPKTAAGKRERKLTR